MRHELGISPRSQFIQIEPLPLTLGRDAVRHKPVQHPVHAVRRRQDEPYQCGHSD